MQRPEAIESVHTDFLDATDKDSFLLPSLALAEAAFAEAEANYCRALEAIEHARGPNHPETATFHRHLAELEHARGRAAEEEVEPLLRQALSIFETTTGPDSSEVAHVVLGISSRKQLAEALGMQA